MPRKAKETTTQAAVPEKKRTAKKTKCVISLQKPAELPVNVEFTGDLGTLIQTYNLNDALVSVNGKSEESDYTLQNGDVVRIGFKSKSN